ncbi:MAG: ribonuclease catalytic domain-containing protein [Burkholderiales bacterium]
MNVFYEEEGALKVAAILADNGTSLQVEAPHGKRSKVKAASVLFRFEKPALADFMAAAQRAADEIDLDFLWECSSGGEFDSIDLATEYYGRSPTPVESGAVQLRLHGAPMYFYKRGKGRYRAAPADALKAALASVERKKRDAERKEAYLRQLAAGELPPDFQPLLGSLLYRPDKNSIEWKALEDASVQLKLTPPRVIERCGGIPSTHDFHLNRFFFEHYPRGTDFGAAPPVETPGELPVSDAIAFSIDDASTTEIDDAFSVSILENGNARIGIHIAAPALGIPLDSPLDAAARERLSTVYFPGGKVTMLPDEAIAEYTLASGKACPALSMYVEVTPGNEIAQTETRVERVNIAGNLRHDTLEPVFNEATVSRAVIEHDYGAELKRLWEWAQQLERARRGDAPEMDQRPEYSFHVENDRVQIIRRRRGTPIDRVVSELMIYVNSVWGGLLAQSKAAAIYRVQGSGKVRMSTVASAHVGLGVEQYVWASSPLRRYVDLVNQRQLVAIARGESPPYRPGDERLLAAMREFESAHEAYGEFQRWMERYWCLRWVLQENAYMVQATVLRENLCRFDELPLVIRVPSVPSLAGGSRVLLEISNIDLLDLTLNCEYVRELRPEPAETEVDSTYAAAGL